MNNKKISNTDGIDEKDLEEVSKIFHPTGVKKMFNYFRHIYRYWKYTFHNLRYWLPLIWKDRDWDYCYLKEILIHKLKSMRDFYQKGENVWCEGADEIANQIHEVIEILERIEEDKYEEAIDPHFNDWIHNGKDHFVDKIDENGNTHCIFDTGEVWTEEEEARRSEVYKQAEINRQADYDKAFSLIGKNIRGWWD